MAILSQKTKNLLAEALQSDAAAKEIAQFFALLESGAFGGGGSGATGMTGYGATGVKGNTGATGAASPGSATSTGYIPGNASDWGAHPPTTVAAALDRIAAFLDLC
jgi:hypothetical protein